MTLVRFALLLMLLPCAAPGPARAQAMRATAEISVGGGTALGRHYSSSAVLSLHAFLGARVVRSHGRGHVIGITFSRVGDPTSDSACHLGPDGGCLPRLPFLVGIGIEGGVIFGGLARGVRLGAGQYEDTKDRASGLGLTAQTDLALSPLFLALRGLYVPDLHGHAVVMVTLTIGPRFK